MRDWLLANAFLAGMGLLAAGLLTGGFTLVRLCQFHPDVERTVIGWLAVLVLVAVGFIARYALRRIERR